MEILTSGERVKILEHVHAIRYELDKWVFAEVHLTLNDHDREKYPIRDIVFMLKKHFASYNGKILVCNPAELLMIIRWENKTPMGLADEIKSDLPEGICEVDIFPPNKAGMARLELNFATLAVDGNSHLLARQVREENISMVADDDILMRKIMRKISEVHQFKIVEVASGLAITGEYLKHLPDVMFLDIHFPDCTGIAILREIMIADPDAYVVMLSADSTQENVVAARKIGAQGFLTKPVTPEKVLDYIRKCPTIYTSTRGVTTPTGYDGRKAG